MAKTTIPAGYFAAGSIATADIADDAVTADKLAANSVVSASIVNGSIVTADLADDAITAAKIDSTATGMTFAGVTSNKDSINVQMQSSTGTSQIYQKFINDGGNSFIGLASSTGAGLLSNAGAYSLNIQTESARNLAFGTNNTLRMLIDSTSGYVGIGTASPTHGLTVSDETVDASASRRITIKSTNHGANAGYRFSGESADGTARSAGYYFQPENAAGSSYLALSADDASDHLKVDANGYATFVHTGGTDFGMQIRTSSTNSNARSGLVIDKPGTTTAIGSALVLRSDETYRLGTANYYHMIMNQSGSTIIGHSGDLSPASTAFKTVINGDGRRTLYVQSGTNGDACSLWLGGGTTPQAAFDSIGAGGAQIWSYESSSWSQITEYKHAYFKSLKDTYIGGNVWINGTGNYNNYDENIRLAYPANGVCVIAWGDTAGTNAVTDGDRPRHSQLYFNSANSFRHRNNNGTTIYTLASGGALSIAGALSQNTSDERLKENVVVIPNALTKVKGIRGVTFDWKDKTPDSKELDVPSSGHDVGVLAQEVQVVLPEAVSLAPFDTSGPDYMEEDVDHGIEEGTSITGENYLTVDYEKLVPLLIESIKELSTELDAAKARITTLEG